MTAVADEATGAGILALWNDCAPGFEAEYEAWYQGEHLFERLGIAGFRCGRRYQAVHGCPRFFTCYETDSPQVLTSPGYVDRLNDPSLLTRKLMAGAFTDMSRTACRRELEVGQIRGAFAVTARFASLGSRSGTGSGSSASASASAGSALLPTNQEQLQQLIDNGVRGELWYPIDPGPTAISAEEELRGGDSRIAACLFVETLRQADALALRARLEGVFDNAEVGAYQLLCQLRSEDLEPVNTN